MAFKSWWLALAMLAVCGAAQALEAGAAKAEITPPLGSPLNGYGDRLGRGALQVHDPLYARCLYLNDGETQVLLVTSDLCIINRELRKRVLELAPKEVPQENIILTATHTHSAQGGMVKPLVFRSVSGPFVPEVLELTAQRFAEAMRAAIDSRRPATVGYGVGEQKDLTSNRRYGDGPTDPQIGVLRVNDANGAPIAIAANLAAHPTTVSDDDLYLISADYPGFFYPKLEALAGADCVAMFMNGAEGNQRPTNPENQPDSWKRTESIGRLLAERVKTVADGIVCEDRKLHIGRATPDLPLTMASTIVFPSTIIETLEVGDLLMTFVPGEPCVEIALALRKRALARGYAAQFTVGLSNDFLAYFAPVAYYSQLHYETAMNFYGPRMQDWLCSQFAQLMTRPPSANEEPLLDRKPVAAGEVETVEQGRRVVLKGSPYAIGYARAAAFRDEIAGAYRAKIVAAVDSGAMLPKQGFWKMVPSFFDATPLALIALGIGVRPFLQGMAGDAFEEIEGMADGAGLPFDALLLVQAAPSIGAQPDAGVFYRAPFCTMLATTGDRAGADDVLVGRNLDWTDDEPPVIVDETPEKGHRFVQVGFPWNVGVFTGMNDAGVVLCAERMESLGRPPIDGAPIEFVLRDLLQTCDSLAAAVERLRACVNLRGYHVLAAGPGVPKAEVVEFGASVVVRDPVKGVLLGADPEGAQVDADAKTRYARLASLLDGEHIVGTAKIKAALADREPGQSGNSTIWNARTRHSVVFEPKNRKIDVMFPDAHGEPGTYTTLSLKGAGR